MDAAASILLILTGEDCSHAIQTAFQYAQSTSRRLRVIQILTSDLFHYGHHDLVATRPSKREFLLYIRQEVLERGKAVALALQDKAREMNISLEIETVESEDLFSASLAEAKKGYEIIFIPKEVKKLFPLFKKTLESYLKNKTSSTITVC
jgi:hypothetical protein